MHPKLVFMGSPDFAIPVLQALVERYEVVGVVTQPDRPAGRGKVLTPPPVKSLAEHYQLPVIQPRRLSQPDAFAQLVAWQPDVIIVAAFGQILKPQVLDLPAFGCVNVHASLLPRWRGAAPIQAAILHGDKQTGVTIMRMDAGIDTGGILSQQAIEIYPQDTSLNLSARLAELGADLLLETLPEYLSGRIHIQEQDDQLATYAPMLKKEDGSLDFFRSAQTLERQVRAFNPWPGAYMELRGQLIKILRAHTLPNQMNEAETSWEPGTKLRVDNLPAVSTAEGLLVLDVLQPAGKKALSGSEFLNGARDWGR